MQTQFKEQSSSYDQARCQKPPNNYAQTHFMQQSLNNDMQTKFKEQTLNKEEKTQNLLNISEQIQLPLQLQNKHEPQLNILQEQMQPNEIYKNHSKSNDYAHKNNSIEVKVSNVQEIVKKISNKSDDSLSQSLLNIQIYDLCFPYGNNYKIKSEYFPLSSKFEKSINNA